MARRSFRRLVRTQALVALAALASAALSAATDLDDAGSCLAGDLSGGLRACKEDDVETQEEALADAARVDLLQLDVRMQAGHDAAGLRRQRALAGAAGVLSPHPSRWQAREQELLDRIEEEDKSIASLQQLVTSQDATIEQLLRDRHGEAAPAASTSSESGVDCERYPMFCDKRINCAENPLTPEETAAINKRIATPDGHANSRSWCVAYPMYATSLQKCVLEGDPEGYAKEMLASQTKMKLLDADAIYCFVSGHCNTTDVSQNTTQADGERLCNARFGHDAWTKVGMDDFKGVLSRASKWGSGQGLPKEWNYTDWASIMALAKRESAISTMTACAMGNYHCDMTYCRRSYCNNPVYRAKWGNLSWVY